MCVLWLHRFFGLFYADLSTLIKEQADYDSLSLNEALRLTRSRNDCWITRFYCPEFIMNRDIRSIKFIDKVTLFSKLQIKGMFLLKNYFNVKMTCYLWRLCFSRINSVL